MLQVNDYFLEEEEIRRLENLEKFEQLYEVEAKDVFSFDGFLALSNMYDEEKIYIDIPLASKISDYFADKIIGNGIYYDVKDQNFQKEVNLIIRENKLKQKIKDIAIAQSRDGYGIFRVRKGDENKPVIEQIPADYYFPITDNSLNNEISEVRIASFLMLNGTQEKIDHLYLERYYYENEKVMLSYELWEVGTDYKLLGQKDIKEYDEDLPDEPIELEWAVKIPIYLVNNTKKNEKDLLGASDYQKIWRLLEEVNNRFTQISVQMIKHSNLKMYVPYGTLNENGEMRNESVDMFEIGEGDIAPQYMEIRNHLINEVIEFCREIKREICSTMELPTEAFGITDKGGAEKVEVVKLRMFNTLRRIDTKREEFEDALQNIMMDCLRIKEIEIPEQEDLNLTWQPFLPVDEKLQTEEISLAIQMGILSKQTAMKMKYGWDDEDIQKELQKIKEENPEPVALSTPFKSFEEVTIENQI